MLEASAKAAAETCDGEELELACALRWQSENEDTSEVGDGGLSEVFSVFEAVQGLLYADAELVSPNATTGNPSNNSTQTGSPKPTGSAGNPDDTSAAGKLAIAWTGIALSGALAVFGL